MSSLSIIDNNVSNLSSSDIIYTNRNFVTIGIKSKPNQKIKINNVDLICNSTRFVERDIALVEGEINKITVLVIAEDYVTNETYIYNIYRRSSGNKIIGLEINNKTIREFYSENYIYNLEPVSREKLFGHNYNVIRDRTKPTSINSKVKIDNDTLIAGTNNTVKLNIISESDLVRTYIFNVYRKSNNTSLSIFNMNQINSLDKNKFCGYVKNDFDVSIIPNDQKTKITYTINNVNSKYYTFDTNKINKIEYKYLNQGENIIKFYIEAEDNTVDVYERLIKCDNVKPEIKLSLYDSIDLNREILYNTNKNTVYLKVLLNEKSLNFINNMNLIIKLFNNKINEPSIDLIKNENNLLYIYKIRLFNYQGSYTIEIPSHSFKDSAQNYNKYSNIIKFNYSKTTVDLETITFMSDNKDKLKHKSGDKMTIVCKFDENTTQVKLSLFNEHTKIVNNSRMQSIHGNNSEYEYSFTLPEVNKEQKIYYSLTDETSLRKNRIIIPDTNIIPFFIISPK